MSNDQPKSDFALKRESDFAQAQEAFTAALNHAEEMLSRNAQNYDALDAKALALCGLAVCENNPWHAAAAAQIFRASRAICKDAGIVKRVLRLFEALTMDDENGVLAEVRKAAVGEE